MERVWVPRAAVAAAAIAACAALGCAAAPDGDAPEMEATERRDEALAAPELSAAETGRTFAIHIEGLCSTRFFDGKAEGRLGAWPGVESVAPFVDQRDSMAVATTQLAEVLDTYCRGDDWCFVYTYSNGGAVLSRTLSLYDGPWNVLFAVTSASAEGGSELGGFGWLGEQLGGCPLSGYVGPGDHRPGWNHHDTNGVTLYQIAGYDGWWYSSALLPGEDDGAVPFHSAGGLAKRKASSWLCGPPEERWANHVPAWTCEGYALDHWGMKLQGICELGGC